MYKKEEGDELTVNVLQIGDSKQGVKGWDSCGLGEKSINKEEWNNEWTGWTGWEPLLLHILKNKNDDSAST